MIAERLSDAGRAAMKGVILVYRYVLSPVIGPRCRHLPSCSEYGLEAIDRNGPWKGLWLTVSRVARCHPWGTNGFDPVPDLSGERHFWAPWRYGRWSWRHPRHLDAPKHACERSGRAQAS